MNKSYIFIFIISFFFVYILFGKYGIFDIIKLEMEKRELDLRLKKMQIDMIIMKHKIELIENSDKEKERIARERLGMIKEGEKIIILKEDRWKK